MRALDGYYADKIAVVTGAGSGIGLAIAQLLGHYGAKVHCVDIHGDAALNVARGLHNARAHTLDVADALAVCKLADAVYAEDGRVDLLFNNAGIGHTADVVDIELDDWRKVIDVNVMGVVHGLHAFLPRMIKQSTPSHVVNTASGAGLIPHPKMALYAASKHAVVGLSTSLSAELHASNVKVTILCPGVINTAIAKSSRMRGETGVHQSNAVEFYAMNGASPESVAKDLLTDVCKAKLFCLTPRVQVGLGWWVYRLSPGLAMRIMRAQINKILGLG